MSLPASQPDHWWIKVCSWLWHRQGYIWGTLFVGLLFNLVGTWVMTKAFDPTGTPLGWFVEHPLFLVSGFVLLLAQTGLARWGSQHHTSTAPIPPPNQLICRERDVLQAIGNVARTVQGPELPTVSVLLPPLQDRYSQQDIIDTLEWFHESGDIQLSRNFADQLSWAFQLTPQGKRALALQQQ